MRVLDLLPVLALLPLGGCFESAGVNELTCDKDIFCPTGYVCVVAQPGVPGKCQRPSDAGHADATISADSPPGTDGMGTADTGADRPISSNDGSAETSAPTDQGQSPDNPTEPDSRLDVPVAPDLGPDVVVPDAPTDNTTGSPDLAPDKANLAPDLVPDVTSDLAATGCTIGGIPYAAGTANPVNACQICKPATSLGAWANADEGTACDSGQYCHAGTCKAGCFISGAYYANGAANPTNGCQTCQTSLATTSWTTGTNGTSCGTGQICSAGTCQSGCWIGGALVTSGTANSSNACQACKPMTSTSGWSDSADGTTCGTGKTCSSGVCKCTTGTDCGASGCVDINANDNKNCGGCGLSCTGNLTCAGGTCQCPNTSSACGSACTACGSGQQCTGGSCTCPDGAAFACNACLSWNFESGTKSGWSLSTRTDGTGTLQLATSTGKGNYSLMIQNAVFPAVTSDLFVQIALCNGVAVTIPPAGFTFSVDVLFQSNSYGFGDDGTGAGSPGVVLEGDGFSHLIAPNLAPFANGTWYTWTWTFTGTAITTMDLRFAPQAPWSGNIVLDNISLK